MVRFYPLRKAIFVYKMKINVLNTIRFNKIIDIVKRELTNQLRKSFYCSVPQDRQAGEFDFSGSQALKAMRRGHRNRADNPNIATIQTPEGADIVYFCYHSYFVEKVIEKELTDGILLAFKPPELRH